MSISSGEKTSTKITKAKRCRICIVYTPIKHRQAQPKAHSLGQTQKEYLVARVYRAKYVSGYGCNMTYQYREPSEKITTTHTESFLSVLRTMHLQTKHGQS